MGELGPPGTGDLGRRGTSSDFGTGRLRPRPAEGFTKFRPGELDWRGGIRGGVARRRLTRPRGTGGLQRPGGDDGRTAAGGLQRINGVRSIVF
jgi:hypothetical protein